MIRYKNEGTNEIPNEVCVFVISPCLVKLLRDRVRYHKGQLLNTLHFQQKEMEKNHRMLADFIYFTTGCHFFLSFSTLLSEDRGVRIYLSPPLHHACPSFPHGWRYFNRAYYPIFRMASTFFIVQFLVCFLVFTCLLNFVLQAECDSRCLPECDRKASAVHLLWFKFVPYDCEN